MDQDIESRAGACAPRMELMLRCAKRHLPGRKKGRREAQILAMASIGFTDNEIAQACGVSHNTVGTYWTRILKRVGARNRTEAVAILMEREIERILAKKKSLSSVGPVPEKVDVESDEPILSASVRPIAACPSREISFHQVKGDGDAAVLGSEATSFLRNGCSRSSYPA